ncbi:glycoside hydrolase family 15 protein [Fictibacillus sp. KU28468]|uniref:glycoside hydrolase family 15 protein n=1 Tax=Fictibacillus sp. KU28468 TaxID=2991053 RepID=UPI00223E07B3|nr:glycoside hydrolase family 15 protein [Fictibacillus sp. KU28468]UZJ80651.1 glycoside hydrolase family 15 protein [Fictibacillus sp. KU28468]
MPRQLVAGNGKILVNIDQHLQIRDIYYPYVGQQNHVQGHANRVGIWSDGHFSWLSSEHWSVHTDYHKDSLVTCCTAENKQMGIRLVFEDGVHQRENMFLRRIKVTNTSKKEKKIRLFFHQDLNIYETEVGDTAFYAPDSRSIIHYKKNRYFLFNALFGDNGISQYTTGIKRFQSAEGTWKDAEDGSLHINPIAQGSVDSTFSVEHEVRGEETVEAFYWMTIGRNREEILALNEYIKEIGPSLTIDKIMIYWRRWANKSPLPDTDLEEEILALYKRSLLIVRTQTNENGYIMAANDSDIQQYNRDHYSYMWPRDGALVAAAIAKAGYQGMVKNFYRRCADVLTKEGFLHHKYNPDGSIGSSWHPTVGKDGKEQLPIQEDETALVLWAFWEHYKETGDIEFAQSLYRSLIRPGARFLLQFMDEELDLPNPSYDLWEERRGVFSFTCSAVYGGLMAAHSFALLFGEDDRAARYKAGAERVKKGMENHLYDQEAGRFLRGIYLNEENREITKDYTIESSMYGLFAFGVFSANDERVQSTMEAIERELYIKTPIGGVARYFNDYYFQQTHEVEKVPGNPWLICTLWLAKWKIAAAVDRNGLKQCREYLNWVVSHAFSSGVLPEQLHPFSGEPLSVAPLTWSHATFVDVVVDYIQAYERLE